jgi:hypothetical protein
MIATAVAQNISMRVIFLMSLLLLLSGVENSRGQGAKIYGAAPTLDTSSKINKRLIQSRVRVAPDLRWSSGATGVAGV